ncbi:hypothetical protein BJV74DRAFT_796512 [Russula compacta]|nr:hypothetical protein BJV74DRAFT_796512 [Russula compacta]
MDDEVVNIPLARLPAMRKEREKWGALLERSGRGHEILCNARPKEPPGKGFPDVGQPGPYQSLSSKGGQVVPDHEMKNPGAMPLAEWRCCAPKTGALRLSVFPSSLTSSRPSLPGPLSSLVLWSVDDLTTDGIDGWVYPLNLEWGLRMAALRVPDLY